MDLLVSSLSAAPRDGSVQPGIKLAPFNGQIINGHAQTEEEAGGRQLAPSAAHIKGSTEVRHAQLHIPSHITCNPTRPPKKKKKEKKAENQQGGRGVCFPHDMQ